MINLELAQKLKTAGLEWKPEALDRFYWHGYNNPFYVWHVNNGVKIVVKLPVIEVTRWSGSYQEQMETDECVWAPRLDQLFTEIAKHYCWDIGNLGSFAENENKVCIGLFDKETREYVKGQIYANTPEDAAALALLWILE